jgi:hypothetical protein
MHDGLSGGVYARTIDTAIQSRPALLIGCQRDVDGVHLLKKKLSYSYAKEAEACTKGKWPQRIAEYEKIFERAPPFISSKVSVEGLRILRNAVGHSFGRDLETTLIAATKNRPLRRLEEEKFLFYLDLVYKVAEAIE